nr:uncharacterized protein LOC104119583 [Nicotiana tomentosiformis]
MDIEEFVDAHEKVLELKIIEVVDTDQAEVTLNMILGRSKTPSTIKIMGWIKGQQVVGLIDSGSTNSFIDPQVAKTSSIFVEELGRPMRVKVANGQYLLCKTKCHNLGWKMQDREFKFNFGILKVGGCDMVLGMDWVDTVSPIILHTHSLSITFLHNKEWVTLWSCPNDGKVSNVETKVISKLMNKGQWNFMAQVFLMGCSRDGKEAIPPPVEKLLGRYNELFQEPKELPPSRECDHAIELVPGAKPINLRPYRYSFDQKNAIEEIVAEMFKAQTITKSVSPFASQVLLVKKKDSNWRMCVDYRKLNDITVKNKYLIPVMEDLLDELHGARFYSKLDLRSGYHQICMKKGDEYKTAFRTHHGLWEVRVMPFGLTNAPATFQALMHQIFGPFLRQFVLVFFDDILVYSASL